MDELAALSPNPTVPPVTDVWRSDELAALEQQVAETEAAVDNSDYDETIRPVEELQLVHGQYPDLSFRARLKPS